MTNHWIRFNTVSELPKDKFYDLMNFKQEIIADCFTSELGQPFALLDTPITRDFVFYRITETPKCIEDAVKKAFTDMIEGMIERMKRK